MITLYTWKTPNGRKPAIMLEEVKLPYQVRPVDISKHQQFEPDFLQLSPNNKVPALVDDDAGSRMTVFESGAILTYLAQKTGQLLPMQGQAHWDTVAWLHWQISGLGPMIGQLNFFAKRPAEQAPLATTRFTAEAERLIGVLERRLTASRHLGHADYSVADIAVYPWIATARSNLGDVLGAMFERSSAVRDWFDRVGDRPAVRKGMALLEQG